MTENLSTQTALDSFPVGYWTPTYRDVSKVWESVKYILNPVIKSKDEQLKQIKLITGGSIDFWSMEDANNGRGFAYKRVIIDECEKARHFKQSWEQVIRATLTDYVGDAWFFSTPKFGQTYFKEIHRNKEKFDDWNSWTMTSYDNPFILASEIDAARVQLDDLTFRCEYLAEDVDLVGKPFAYAFSEAKHTGSVQFNDMHELHVSFDFNVDPITAIAEQFIDGQISFIREFKIPNSDIYELCDRILAAYPFAAMLVTGDATGRARQAISKGNINYYQVIRQRLGLGDAQMRQPTVNPSVSDTRVLMNSVFQRGNVLIDKENCPGLIYDLKYVEVDDHGDIVKDRTGENKKADLLDCCRYDLHTFYRNMIRVL